MIAPSGTTMTDYNPAFSVIDWDKEFMVPVNIHTYFLNITETNLNDKAEWKLLHDLKNEYDLIDLSPDSMANLLDRLYANGTLASQFEWNRDRRRNSSPPDVKPGDMEYKCLKTTESFEENECYGNPPISSSSTDVTGWFEYLIGDWIAVSDSKLKS
jgi:hypothetical protein